MTIEHGLWVTIITRHAYRWFTEMHHCARQLCVHGLWAEMHFCTRWQDALQSITDILYQSAWIYRESPTCGLLCMMSDERWTQKCHGKRIPLLTKEPWFVIPLLVESCETTQHAFAFEGYWGKPLSIAGQPDGTAWWDGLSNDSHMTILNTKSSAWTKTSWVLNSYQRKHGTYKVQWKCKEAFLTGWKACMSWQ